MQKKIIVGKADQRRRILLLKTRMKHYFSFWEREIYNAIRNLVKVNLDDFFMLIESTTPLFSVEVVLQNMNVAISPSEQLIMKGIITIIKNLLDGTKRFIRWGKGTCIPVPPVRVKNEIRPIQPSFYDDIIRLPEIIEKVDIVQASIVNSLENVQTYLSSWKKMKNLWKFDKKNTLSVVCCCCRDHIVVDVNIFVDYDDD